jgi:hypothetical protein
MTCRSAFVAVATVFAALSALAASAQLPGPIPKEKEPPSRARFQEQRIPVTVSGCLRGTRLNISAASQRDGVADLLKASQFILEGPKDLLQQIRREHQGHEDEISGIAIIKPSPDGTSTTDVSTKPLGKKGSITVGVHESSGVAAEEVEAPVRLKVESLRHLADACADRAFQ